jgi:hypothetical protein
VVYYIFYIHVCLVLAVSSSIGSLHVHVLNITCTCTTVQRRVQRTTLLLNYKKDRSFLIIERYGMYNYM